MDAYLIIANGEQAGRVLPLPKSGKFSLGRHRSNDLVIHGEHVSRKHAVIYLDDDKWWMQDLESSNGTYVQEEKITTRNLTDGCEIRIAKSNLRFSFSPEIEPTTPEIKPTSELIDESRFAADDLSELCHFMADAVDASDTQLVVRRALESVLRKTRAQVVGYLAVEEANDNLSGIVLPANSTVDRQLSRTLAREIGVKRTPVWLHRDEKIERSDSLAAIADAICIPLLGRENAVLGGLHAYTRNASFTEREFKFCEVVARHLAGCLRLDRLLRQLAAENTRLRLHAPIGDRLVGTSQALQRIRQLIQRVARDTATVLIRGESGVGKELVAKALHEASPRRGGPFVTANCANTDGDLIDSRLFGHKKGSFTNAVADREGLLRTGDGGTVFLDEVGELPLAAQAKLLRVLDGQGFTQVGSDRETKVDVRFIAATNRHLENDVRMGSFREDLYFRLQVIEIRVPPLRERSEDVPELVNHVLEHYATESGRQLRVSEDAVRKLAAYHWPGNVRQLWSVIRNAALNIEGDLIDVGDLRLGNDAPAVGLPSLNIRELERSALEEALRRTNNNVTETCRLLGVVRGTVYNMASRYGIKLEGGLP